MSGTETLTILGALVGVVGVSIAVWLQLIARRRCPWYWVAGFFAFGSFMLLLNSGVFGLAALTTTALASFALLAALVAELAGAFYVYRHYSRPRTETAVEQYLARIFKS